MPRKELKSSDIPNIDLYMDQLISFFEDYLGSYKRDPKEKILTKTMVNNYVKNGVMEKPHKRKYNKNQLESLFILYHLKQILSLQDIKSFFQLSNPKYDMNLLFEKFLAAEKKSSQQMDTILEELNLSQYDDPDIISEMILELVVQACARKRLAEKLIDKIKVQRQAEK